MKRISNEVKVGIFFIIFMTGLLWLIVSTGKFHIKEKGYNIYISFGDVGGLEKNSPVMLNGLQIGRVQDAKVSYSWGGTKIILKIFVRNGIKIGNDALVSIKTLGVMGEKYVHISSWKAEEFLEPEALIEGRIPSDMDAFLNEAELFSKNASELAVNVNDIVKKNSETLSKTISNMNKMFDRLNYILTEHQEDIDQLISSAGNAFKNFEEFSEDIKNHPWKLLFKTEKKENKRKKAK